MVSRDTVGFKRFNEADVKGVEAEVMGVHMDGDNCENDSDRQRHHSNE
jgi:hypothetical protein